MPYGMEDVTGLPKLTAALLEHGFSPDEVRGILGGNLLRVMEKVEAVATRR
jgi:membrane dipeptidase